MTLSKRGKRAIVVLVAISCVLVAGLFIPGAIVEARLRRRLEAIRAAGDPVTLDGLTALYPPLPRERNAAILLLQAFDKVVAVNEEASKGLPFIGYADLPPIGEPVPQDTLAAMERHLAANGEALRLVHQAVALDDCRFDLTPFGASGQMALAPYGRLRYAKFLLSFEVICHTERGRQAEAARSMLAGLRLARSLRRVPDVMGFVVRSGLDHRAMVDIERWVGRAQPVPAQLRALEAALRAEADPGLLRTALAAERCVTIDTYFSVFIRPAPGMVPPPVLSPSLDRFVPRAYFKADLIRCLDLIGELVDAAGKPYPQSVLEGARLAQNIESRVPSHFVMGRQAMGFWHVPFRAMQYHMAWADSARAGLAALRYRAKHGALPEELEDLVPDFIDAVPPDPYDAKPLRYRKTADGFIVYAVGENGADDGGQTELVKGKRPDTGFRVRWPKASSGGGAR